MQSKIENKNTHDIFITGSSDTSDYIQFSVKRLCSTKQTNVANTNEYSS